LTSTTLRTILEDSFEEVATSRKGTTKGDEE
jgi:hypothetical protein